MTATPKVRVKMGFGGLTDTGAATLVGNVTTGLPNTFDLKTLVPPVSPVDLNKAKDDLLTAGVGEGKTDGSCSIISDLMPG